MTRPNHSDRFLEALNRASDADAARMLDPILERSPWLARRVANARPFTDIAELTAQMRAQITTLSDDERLVLLRAHPELAPPEPALMTSASQVEQGRLSLDRADDQIGARLRHLNDEYRARHGFPFIIALHAAPDLTAVLAQFASSLDQNTETEIARALDEVVSVASARLEREASSAARTSSEGQQ
ncbi:2-oxo-4-hydroxy-4-carboxy-5-ureidoimidazoline decarboxylase [Jannaschia pohangensis]|uniref:2-oxo-4-hydroxy-4-carboxy-5-ureidoimidazoline decarboxylase n=1 Tax=Jannaschia pohangensis TaxID=390807 RepID=A0A1I3GX23_9RHOB|nr:2-oxo-4-hydroxy-4-carboxy-5-ureidoimidazoline decarboxylase [Jannaschia pohangensis]SFI28125.1 2-oxo-4-hydroxy-4-carboxy-5-ureidoimidazoline decarboxylase [Jannaschia pohangensis]